MRSKKYEILDTYEKLGWAYIPLRRKDKRPLPGITWGEHISTPVFAEQQAEYRKAIESQNLNVGILTGRFSGLMVIDFDFNHGGDKSLKKLTEKGIIDQYAPSVRTPNGKHIYYAYPKDKEIGNSVEFMKGVDIRANGGYVVAPPSRVDGKEYIAEQIFDRPLTQPPEELLQIISRPKASPQITDKEYAQLLKGVAEGQRHNTAVRLGGYLTQKGHPPEVAMAILAMWNKNNKPPLTEAELNSIYPSLTNWHKQDFGERKPFALPISEFMRCRKKVEWLINGLIPLKTVNILAAKPKVGKSMLTLNLAIACTQGSEFLGRGVKKTNTLVLQLEDAESEIQKRIDKMVNQDFPEGLFIGAERSFKNRDWPKLKDFIVENSIGFVIIDPFVYAFDGDEQSAQETSKFMRGLKELSFDFGVTVLIVHHLRKSEGNNGDEIRGSSALLGAVDVALVLKREGKEKDKRRKMTITSRYAMVEDQILQLETSRLTWENLGKAEEIKQRKGMSNMAEVLKMHGFIGPEHHCNHDKLKELFGDYDTYNPSLQSLVKEGTVVQSKMPSSERGGAPKHIFWLNLPSNN